MFQKNILLPLSGLKSKPQETCNKQRCLLLDGYLLGLFLDLEVRTNAPVKHQWTTGLHRIMFQKNVLFRNTFHNNFHLFSTQKMHCYHHICFYGMFITHSNVQQDLAAEHNVGAGYIFLCSVPPALAKVLKFTEVQVQNMAIMILIYIYIYI
jgi:hypothetical protein